MDLAPVIIFAYNRLDHLKLTINALQNNKTANDTKIYIYSDGPKNEKDIEKVKNIRNFLKDIKGFNSIEIVEQENNKGLANSIINGVTEIINRYGKVIVLEDDLITSPDFLYFMNHCLETFAMNKDIFSISGYSPPNVVPKDYQESIYLSYRINSWGWATWKDRWDKVDWSVADFNKFIKNKRQRKLFNKGGADSTIMLLKQKMKLINSWAIRFYYACFKNNAYCIYPSKSLIQNIGTDGSGTNFKKSVKKYYTTTNDFEKSLVHLKDNMHICLNDKIIKNFKAFFKPSLYRKCINFYKLNRYLFIIRRKN